MKTIDYIRKRNEPGMVIPQAPYKDGTKRPDRVLTFKKLWDYNNYKVDLENNQVHLYLLADKIETDVCEGFDRICADYSSIDLPKDKYELVNVVPQMYGTSIYHLVFDIDRIIVPSRKRYENIGD